MQESIHAEIISTGDEVLTGAVVDTNASFIARKLIETGIPVDRHSCAGDDEEKVAAILREAGERADIAIITGGLGPTVDDVTSSAAARAAGVEIAESPTARAYIETFFANYNRTMTGSDARQAMLPEGAEPIYNPIGTAPGFKLVIGRCTCFFLPGVPSEMKRMINEYVIPSIEAGIAGEKRRYYGQKLLSLFGLPEAEVNERLSEVSKGFGNVRLGMIARFPVIDVKLTAYGRDKSETDEQIDKAAGQVKEILGRWIFSTRQQSMEEVVGELLGKKKFTVALAESCTGGLIAHRLTNVSGSSDYFMLSAVTYSNAAKSGMLGVSPETIREFGAVSEETAREMAEGARKAAGADFGLSTSGIAGPAGGTDEKPVGTVCIGLAAPGETFSRRMVFPFRNRLANKEIFAYSALDMLRRKLLEN